LNENSSVTTSLTLLTNCEAQMTFLIASGTLPDGRKLHESRSLQALVNLLFLIVLFTVDFVQRFIDLDHDGFVVVTPAEPFSLA